MHQFQIARAFSETTSLARKSGYHQLGLPRNATGMIRANIVRDATGWKETISLTCNKHALAKLVSLHLRDKRSKHIKTLTRRSIEVSKLDLEQLR